LPDPDIDGGDGCEFLAPIALSIFSHQCPLLWFLTVLFVQNQAVCLNKVMLARGKDIDIPEQWGFLHNNSIAFPAISRRLTGTHSRPGISSRQHFISNMDNT
jgi:hypothetical protein